MAHIFPWLSHSGPKKFSKGTKLKQQEINDDIISDKLGAFQKSLALHPNTLSLRCSLLPNLVEP